MNFSITAVCRSAQWGNNGIFHSGRIFPVFNWLPRAISDWSVTSSDYDGRRDLRFLLEIDDRRFLDVRLEMMSPQASVIVFHAKAWVASLPIQRAFPRITGPWPA
ncbi:hypothetical protein [Paraburkholderia terrae]|uniref:hypothetical protein n=1 Tax=Paraburkholderia terrae TaxID=311230 RepID=UPI0020C03DC2|nr:hypothetical protein [Paraburkholderia terrae]